jgi:hypothetical protein
LTALVESDSTEPRAEAVGPYQSIKTQPSDHCGLLDRITSQFAVMEYAITQCLGTLLVSSNQLSEGTFVAQAS